MAGSLPPNGTWVVGVDSRGTAYLFQQGARKRGGGIATAAGLTQWTSLGTSDLGTMAGRLSAAMARVRGLDPGQQAVFMQSVDVGAIEQGNSYVAAPRGQKPGTTLKDQGQVASSSEAVFAPIIPSPSNPFKGIEDFLHYISWIFHPLNVMRAVEFLTGIGMMAYGLSTLLGVMRRGRATHRTTLGMMFGGWRQGRRDRAYQNARRRARAPSQTTRTGNPQTYTPRS